MSYLGNNNLPWDISRSSPIPTDAERFSGNSSTTTFTLTRSVNFATDLEVFVENIRQEPITAYSVNGNSLLFTEAPPTGTNNVYVVYRNYQSGAQVSLPDGSITYSKLANNIRVFTTDNYTANGNVSSYGLSEPPADANTVFVTVDGVVQRAPAHYTTSGTTITFTSAPPLNANVHIRHLGFRTTSTITVLAANSTISQPNIVAPTITGTLTTSAIVPSANATSNIGSPTATYNNIYGTHVGAVISSQTFGFKNKIINGNFDFWQRATSYTYPGGIWLYGHADRWAGHFDASAAGTWSRSTNVPDSASTYSMRVTGVSGGSSAYLNQRIEANEMREIVAKGAVTISGWVRRVGGPTSSIGINLITPTATDNYSSYNTIGACFTVNNTITGNGTASGSSLTLTDNSTWYYFTVTDTSIASRTDIAKGMQLYFSLGGLDANTKYFEFSRLQIEADSAATPFEFRPYGIEESLCQRYYWKLGSTSSEWRAMNFIDGTSIYRASWDYPVTMRTTPALTTGGFAYRVSSGSLTNGSVSSSAPQTGMLSVSFSCPSAPNTYGHGSLVNLTNSLWAVSAEL